MRARGRALRSLLILSLVFVVLGVSAGGVYLYAVGGSGPSSRVEVVVPRGATAAEVGDLLEDAGVIRSALAFRVMARFRGGGTEIKAGQYALLTNMSLDEVFLLMDRGPEDTTPTVVVTIPEGYRVEQVADRVADQLGLSARGFIRAAKSGDFELPPYLPQGTETVEGFLFPETYEIRRSASVQDVIDRQLGQFRSVAEGLPWAHADDLGVTPYEVVIIASLIEEEARVPEDRAKISAVIYNRLARGMNLEIDATVLYALGRHKERVLFEDLEVESPYNTYRNPGLPPTPIASPGVASLEAALQPADADYLYYVVIDDQGHHAFTASYEEFLRFKEQAQQDSG
jgi:peptidoglycan lytic transglycosylase G